MSGVLEQPQDWHFFTEHATHAELIGTWFKVTKHPDSTFYDKRQALIWACEVELNLRSHFHKGDGCDSSKMNQHHRCKDIAPAS